MKFPLFLIPTLLLAWDTTLLAQQPSKLTLQPGDHIGIMGNSLASRMLFDGTLEALIHKAHPNDDISIRNLGFDGDEINVNIRSDEVPPPQTWLEKIHADVILAFWGFNESFKGPTGLDAFKANLDTYLKNLKASQFNKKSAPRIILFSPIAQEKGKDPNWPDPTANNANLQLYTTAMAEIAKANDIPFIDLFTPSQKLYNDATNPLTHNGIHLTVNGYHQLAPVLYEALFATAPPAYDADVEKIRAAVVVKNETWLARYRTVDQFNIFGSRSTIPYQSTIDGKSYDNRYVLWPELAVRDVMTENREKRVWALAKGSDLTIDDSNVPAVPKIGTNKPGPNPDGSHTYLDPEEAIKHMTVPKGVKVELVASEIQFPELVSPVQMNWDTKGRLWISAWKNYPERTPDSKEGDKLLILDIGPDGKATTCTTYYDNLNCPTGFQFYKDGVLVMKSPDLLYLRDTDGDGKGELQERVLNGIDAADSHHETNSMAIEPGGAIYLSDGVFHRTNIETAQGPVRNYDGAIYRWEPRTGKFERYIAYSFANPHGKVFDYWGNDIMTDATGNANYFGPAFSGHIDYPNTHPGMKEFWDRPTRPCPGTAILSSRAWPAEFNGNFLNCNVISIQGIFRAKISEDGSALKGETLEHLITSDDPNFRPSGISVAPDGSLYLMDWHKPLIGHLQHHLRDPNREQSHGRIYRLTFEGMPLLTPPKIHGEPIPALLDLLKTPENNVRERAKIELSNRDTTEVIAATDTWLTTLDKNAETYEHDRLEGLWVKQQHNVVDLPLLNQILSSPEPRARAQAVRVLVYWRERVPNTLALLKTAALDQAPRVRLEAIRAASFFPQWEAADTALAALSQPTDYYIDYCLKETMRQLEPWWRNALSEGKPIADGNSAGITYILNSVATHDLLHLPKSTPVYTALLTRPDVPFLDRLNTLNSIAKEQNVSVTQAILEKLGAPNTSPQATDDLCRTLLLQPKADLTAQLSVLQTLIASLTTPDTVLANLTAATYLARGSVNDALAAAKNPTELTTLLRAIPLIPDLPLRATAYTPIAEIIKKVPDSMTAQANGDKTSARFVRISLPGNATLTLAEVEVCSDAKNIAPSGKASQSSEAFGGTASRAIDGNTSGTFVDGSQTHTAEGNINPWWELDLGENRSIDSVQIWNRTEQNGQLASRLDHFTLTLLDANRREIFTIKDQPAPAEKVSFPLKGDPISSLQRAAITALASINEQQENSFRILTELITNNVEIKTTAAAMRSINKTAWNTDNGIPALNSILTWATTTPVEQRTAPSFVETMQLANDLASLLPPDQAAPVLKQLNDFRINVFIIKAVREQMRYDTSRIVVETGKSFEVIFENPDIMPHNIVFVQAGLGQKISEEVMPQPPSKLDQEGRAYLPGDGSQLDPRILAASKMLEASQSATLTITAPSEEGAYDYVCTFPGHSLIMHGTLIVTNDVNAYLQAHP